MTYGSYTVARYFRSMAEKIDLEASKNEDFNKLAVSELNRRLHKIHQGGGEIVEQR